MLYTLAHNDWTPGSPLDGDASRRVFYRTRAAALEASPGRSILAVALRYDAARSTVFAHAPREVPWTAPALIDDSERVTILASIPAFLVRAVTRPTIRLHPGARWPLPRIAFWDRQRLCPMRRWAAGD